ncbi:MAG: hypothetical protein QM495_04495 [Lutibacter sp.]
MKSIITQNSKTTNSTFELMSNNKRTNWNNRRRYSNLIQFKFI